MVVYTFNVDCTGCGLLFGLLSVGALAFLLHRDVVGHGTEGLDGGG